MKVEYSTDRFQYVLKTIRRGRGLTQEQLSERLGICPSFVGQLETGRKLPSLEMLFRIAGALDIAASEIVRQMEDESAA